LSEESEKWLREIHARAEKLTEDLFPEVEKYKRDRRLTIITLMGYLIELEKLRRQK